MADTREIVTRAARSFDAELHTGEYARVHHDDEQLGRLLAWLRARPGETCLDLGTGNGYVAAAVARECAGCHVVGVDVAANAVRVNAEEARRRGAANLHFARYAGVALPFADASFDAVVSRYAFHHFPRPRRSLSEIARVLRRGGRLVLADAVRDDADDVDFVNRFQALKGDGHVRMPRASELVAMVEASGFACTDRFESAIEFGRARTPDHDALVAATAPAVLERYAVRMDDAAIRLRFAILNTRFARMG